MFVFYLVSQPFVRIHLCTRTRLCVCVFVRVYCYRESWSEFQLKGECFQVRKKSTILESELRKVVYINALSYNLLQTIGSKTA